MRLHSSIHRVYDDVKCLLRGKKRGKNFQKISRDFTNVHVKYERKWCAQFERYNSVHRMSYHTRET